MFTFFIFIWLVLVVRQDSAKLGKFLGKGNRETEIGSPRNWLYNFTSREMTSRPGFFSLGPEMQQNQARDARISCND